MNLMAAAMVAVGLAQAPAIIRVSAPDLDTQPELVGRSVAVEGRNPRFEFDRRLGWNSFRVEKSSRRFLLAPGLGYQNPPNAQGILVRGVVEQSPAGRIVRVSAPPELLPSDLDRFDKAVGALPATDYRLRNDWADWAESRSKLYSDDALASRARATAAEALRIEAEASMNRAPERQIELASRARQRKLPEPEPSVIAHRGLRGLLDSEPTGAGLEKLIPLARALLPQAALSAQSADLGSWAAAYKEDPGATYRKVDTLVRSALDRELYADILTRDLEVRLRATPEKGFELAEQAADQLPDRPSVSRSIARQALESTDVRLLRLAELQERVRLYEKLGDSQGGRELVHAWLDEQRKSRLGANDAEGRLRLAGQYESLASDHETAEALLREAWAIDPDSEDLAEAFRVRGFRLSDGRWIASPNSNKIAAASADSGAAGAGSRADPYAGLSRPEVIERLGKPDVVSRLATQGQLREQWIYIREGKSRLYLNFLQRLGGREGVVVSSYSSSSLSP